MVLLTVALGNAKEDEAAAQDDVAGLQQQVDALQQQVDVRDETIQTLEDANAQQADEIEARDRRIEELEAASGGADAATAEGAATPEVGAPSIPYRRYSLLDLCFDSRATVNNCTDPRVATVAGRQFEYINKSVQAGDWREFITLPEADCREVHIEFGSPDINGLATGWSQVRLSTGDREPASARAAEGEIGRLDVTDLAPGPISVQAIAEYGNSTVAFNGWALCRDGSVN